MQMDWIRTAVDSAIPLYYYDTLDSTNTKARILAQEGAPFCVVIAEEQTAGRGRLGRRFFSPAGHGVYCSIVFPFLAIPKQLSLLTPTIGLLLSQSIERCADGQISCQLKWPNDILIAEKKVCGILVQLITNPETGHITHAIIGTGINVTQPATLFPADLQHQAGSIFSCTGQQVVREALCADWIRTCWQLWTADAQLQHLAPYLPEIRKRSWTLGHRVHYTCNGIQKAGMATQIADDGSLVIQTECGYDTISMGEVDASCAPQTSS